MGKQTTNAESIKQLAADLYGSADTSAKNYSADYKKTAAANAAAQNQAAKNYNAAVDALKKENEVAYDNLRTDALGLSRRRLDAPTEQIVEDGAGIYGTAAPSAGGSAQILHDNAIGNAFNDITAARKTETENLLLAQKLADLERQSNNAQDLADLTQQQIQAQRAENQSAATAIGTASQYLAAAQDSYNAQKQSEISLAEMQKQNAYQNALNEVNTFGRVLTKAAAEALGVPIGTTAAYAKVNRVSSGGGGGGGSSYTDPYEGVDYDEAFLAEVLSEGKDTNTAYNYQLQRMKANGGGTADDIKNLNQALRAYIGSQSDQNKKRISNNEAIISGIAKKREKEKAAESATIASSRTGYAGGRS